MSAKLYRPTDLTAEVLELFKLEDDLRELGVSDPDWLMEQLSLRGWEFWRDAAADLQRLGQEIDAA